MVEGGYEGLSSRLICLPCEAVNVVKANSLQPRGS